MTKSALCGSFSYPRATGTPLYTERCPTLLLMWISREGVMKRHWQIRRTLLAATDGQRRWDQAYQQLLIWTSPDSSTRATNGEQEAEGEDARRDLCASINATTGTGADD
jgi:hypothetical protein